jgi:hypothetical protein
LRSQPLSRSALTDGSRNRAERSAAFLHGLQPQAATLDAELPEKTE